MSEPNPMFPAAHNAGVRRPAILAVPVERGLQWLVYGIVGLILLVLVLLPLLLIPVLLGSIYAGYEDIHGQVVTAPSSPATAG